MATQEGIASVSVKENPEIRTVVRDRKDEMRPRLGDWEIDVIVSSLEGCLDEMGAVLQRTNIKTTNTNLSFVPTDVRYLELIKSRLLYTSEERALKDMETEAAFQKLKNDSTYVVGIMEETVQELRSCGSFSVLANVPEKLANVRAKETAVLTRARKNLEDLKNLRELVSREKSANELERNERLEELAAAMRGMKVQYAKGKATMAYVSAWERARCEQNFELCGINEEKLRKNLSRLLIEEDNEKRVTSDIETFLCCDIAKSEEQIVQWKDRYDRELAEYNNEIDRLQKQINRERTALETLREEQRVKQNFIDVFLAQKESARKKKEHEEHVQRSTIKIQAWWRGVMVRRKLGPYRLEEKKKKRPNKPKK